MATFIAHLNVTIEHLTRYKQKVVLAVIHVGGQEHALQHGGQYKSCYFVEKSKYPKISPLNMFPLNFLSNFGNSKITTHCLRKALVT